MSYLSRREEELLETKRSQALALQILEAFTTQSTQDLRRLELLSGLWQNVDRNILRTLEGAQGREGTAKLLCELIVWKALEYWLMEDGTPSGQSDAEILAEFKAKVAAAAAAEPVADSPDPEPEPVAERLVSFPRPNGKPVSFVAKSPRKRGPFPTYAELLARRTPRAAGSFQGQTGRGAASDARTPENGKGCVFLTPKRLQERASRGTAVFTLCGDQDR